MTFILPFISFVSCFVMARPSPVPSICLFLFSSNRENESKRCEIFSDLMPMPVSDIVKVIIIFFAGCEPVTLLLFMASAFCCSDIPTFNVTEPFSVYFIALFNMFTSICRMRTSSPYSLAGRFLSLSTLNASPFSFALPRSI